MRRNLSVALPCLLCGLVILVSSLLGGPSPIATISAAGFLAPCPAGGCKDTAFPANPDLDDFSPTAEKPQSKLWYNDGRWWASMLHSDGHYYIFYLDGTTWTKTNTMLDSRLQAQADCLWDGTHLYVASGGGDPDSSGIALDGLL